MSPLQVAKQLRWIIRQTAWPEGSQEKVVGNSTYVTPGVSEGGLDSRVAFALVTPGPITPDAEDPNLITAEFMVMIGTEVKGDPNNEHSVTGGARLHGDVGRTAGKGILEIAVPILAAIRSLVGADGLPIITSYTASPDLDTIPGESNSEIVTQTFVLSCLCTTEDEWPAPSEFQNSGGNLTWTSAPDLYALREYVIRGSATSTPPASPADGVAVFNGLGNAHTDTTGSVSFAIFAAYTETGVDRNQKFSQQERGTVTS